MNEKEPTLNEVGAEAARIYGEYEAAEENITSEAARYEKLQRDHEIDRHHVHQLQVQKDHSQVFYGQKSQAAIEDGAAHFEAHQAAYHDLALIEAHMAGVAINVEQPIVVGEKVEETKVTDTHE